MTSQRKYAVINIGWNSPSFPAPGAFDTNEKWVALGFIAYLAADPGQISWLVQGYYTVGRDMVKGY